MNLQSIPLIINSRIKRSMRYPNQKKNKTSAPFLQNKCHVTQTYLLYKIEDTSLVLELKVIFNLRAAKNAAIISEFVEFSTLILL